MAHKMHAFGDVASALFKKTADLGTQFLNAVASPFTGGKDVIPKGGSDPGGPTPPGM